MKKLLTVLYALTVAHLVHAVKAASSIFKKDSWKKKDWVPILDHFEWSIKLYSLVIVIPITFTVIYVIWLILGMDPATPLWEMWVKYFATGSLLDIVAWRWHLFLFFFANLITISTKNR